ncbi:GILT-like protein 2 [Manduca sexta]|uniref:GILT-like protein 2 n=1 Tax=Manduca sexta TaxID=7130 RepID=UPI0018900B0D|nr:GILT-like protein 2 [Manduca sexta]
MDLLFIFTALVTISVAVQCDNLAQLADVSNQRSINEHDNDPVTNETIKNTETEKVVVDIYYESRCPVCINFFVNKLEPEIPSLHEFLDIRLYPYGNAYTTKKGDQYEVSCQHGESECYGNKLHACAIDILKNVTKSTLFISCASDWYSDDKAVDECSKWLKFNGEPIKKCAKSDKGHQLLKYYGDESNKIYYPGVPHVRINGIHAPWNHFKENVCTAFKTPPPPCRENRNKEIISE